MELVFFVFGWGNSKKYTEKQILLKPDRIHPLWKLRVEDSTTPAINA
jgi:hypothetical protein